MNLGHTKTLYKVKDGPVLQGFVQQLDDADIEGGPLLFKTRGKNGKTRYELYFVQGDTLTDVDWAFHWPNCSAEAILNYSRNGGPHYIGERSPGAQDKHTPGKYALEDFEPQQAVDDFGYELYDVTLYGVKPDLDNARDIVEAGPDEEFYEGCVELLKRAEAGENLTVEKIELKNVSDARCCNDDIYDKLEAALGYPVEAVDVMLADFEEVMEEPKAIKELPDWAWDSLEVYDHSGQAWHLSGGCMVDRKWDVTTGVGYFYLVPDAIKAIEDEAAKHPEFTEAEAWSFKRGKFTELWDTFCKPVLDGDICACIRCAYFDENGDLIDTEELLSGLYWDVVRWYKKTYGIETLLDFVKRDTKYTDEENITGRLEVCHDYDFPTV